jgi:hypothetical protein
MLKKFSLNFSGFKHEVVRISFKKMDTGMDRIQTGIPQDYKYEYLY